MVGYTRSATHVHASRETTKLITTAIMCRVCRLKDGIEYSGGGFIGKFTQLP